MSIEKMREEFEAWAISCAWLGLSDECMTRDETGYLGLELHAAWLAWQASRAALVIELPKRDGRNMYGTDVFEKSDLISAIEAAGVKVKP